MPNPNITIQEKYQELKITIENQAKNSGFNAADIHIVAVTKTFPVSIVQKAVDSGIMEIGENKVQEACDKLSQIKGNFLPHFIGILQRNKIKDIVKYCSIFHSISKVETAQALEKELDKLAAGNSLPEIYSGYLNIPKGKAGFFIQVNTTSEESKSGISPGELLNLAENLVQFKRLIPLGLMTIGPTYGKSAENRQAFAILRELREQCAKKISANYRYLSMGMSGDFEDAIAEGASHLRIGSRIFGERDYAH